VRLATFESKFVEGAQAGIVLGNRVAPFAALGNFPDTVLALIEGGPEAWQELREAASEANSGSLALDDVTLLAPIPRTPKNVMCLGWNYSAHADESARAIGKEVPLPEHPIVFSKSPLTINSPYGDIVYDRGLTEQLDWEVELGVVIGTAGKSIPVDRALEHVFGYTVVNDVSARDLQQRHRQFFLGKSLDGACPMGPWIVTADELSDPQDLTLRTRVNGILKQDGCTADQIFGVAETISILSRGMTLEPGDVIATGTPDGVGFARTPPEYLKDGDMVSCEVVGIGELRNRIVAER
jgi:2-keto-4-pentenoate hydratase/2-oxohepta-3-ene-1,7-dioic acid hydratase in catechol pathway